MRHLESETLINARSSTVWNVITDAGNLTVWDSGITAIEGEIRNGGTIRIKTAARGARTVRIRVQQLPGEVMTWTGGLPLGLFKRIRTFTLSPHAGLTRLRVTEELSGPLRGLHGYPDPDTDKPLNDFVSAVRTRAELLDKQS